MSLRKKKPLSNERRIPSKEDLRRMEEESWAKFGKEKATIRIDLAKTDDGLERSENFKEIGVSDEGVIIHDPVESQNLGVLIGQRKWRDRNGSVHDVQPRKVRGR